MSYIKASNSHHAAIRAEVRELHIGFRTNYSALLLSLMAACCTASAVLTITAY